MDLKTSYNLEIRIISSKSRARWFSINKVVDADITNFKYFVDEILDKYLCSYGDVAKVFYFYANSKTNIEISYDQELVQMFRKHKDTKCCLMSVAYFSPDRENLASYLGTVALRISTYPLHTLISSSKPNRPRPDINQCY